MRTDMSKRWNVSKWNWENRMIPDAAVLSVGRPLAAGRRHQRVEVAGRAGGWTFDEEPGDRAGTELHRPESAERAAASALGEPGERSAPIPQPGGRTVVLELLERRDHVGLRSWLLDTGAVRYML